MHAFVSLITSDHYLPGALALAAALRDLHPPPSPCHILCLVTPESVHVKSIKLLRKAFDLVVGVELILHNDIQALRLLGRPDLTHVLTKLHVFRLTDYSKVLFLDADVLPLRPLSHLFHLPYDFAAVPDVGWPDIFNSGVMLLEPAEHKFNEIMSLLRTKGSWDGGDQGILNEWRGGDWHRLSFTYNTTPTAAYTYAPAYTRFGDDIKAIHFIGPNKPWSSLPYRAPFTSDSLQTFSSQPHAYGYDDLVDRWYAVYDKHYRSQAPVQEEEFKIMKFESAWNTPQPPTPPAPFGLDELRRMAVEGVSTSLPTAPSTITQAPTPEGHYRSLPLEGRLDLMRPPVETKEDLEDESVTPKAIPQTPMVPPSITLPQEPPQAPVHQVQLIPSPRIEDPPNVEYFPPPPPLRPSSPPMILWNPALEPPPSNPPPQTAFKPDLFFENAWDVNPSRTSDHEDAHGFFVTPPQSKIPDTLIKEGHYSNVMQYSTPHLPTSESTSRESSQPPPHDPHQPDKAKVMPVFPWEDKPRRVPGRIFPRAASPPPSTSTNYLSEEVTSPIQPDPEPEPPLPLKKLDIPPPLTYPPPSTSYPGQMGFKNAWDNVPSIQRYATRLQRPQPQPQPPTRGRRSRRGSATTFKSWEEPQDSSSHEGDNEDEGDDFMDVDEPVDDELSPTSKTGTKKGDKASAGRRVSRSSLSRDDRTGKTYRSQSTQTTQPARREVGVQSPSPQPSRRSSISTSSHSPIISTGAPVTATTRRPPIAFGGLISVGPTLERADSVGTPTVEEPNDLLQSTAAKHAQLVTTARDPAPAGHRSSPPQRGKGPSEPIPAAPPAPAPALPPRLSSDETLSSSQASLGPVSPRDGQPVSLSTTSKDTQHNSPPPLASSSAPPKRPASRTWDPARGVEVFKRESEEVLARFLRMGSWESG